MIFDERDRWLIGKSFTTEDTKEHEECMLKAFISGAARCPDYERAMNAAFSGVLARRRIVII
jgi:hypothetical protein